jgi:hypothetical protein
MNALRLAKLRAAASSYASPVLTYTDMFRASKLAFLASLAYRASARIKSASMVKIRSSAGSPVKSVIEKEGI